MKIFEYIDRINLMHKLIYNRKTGTPDEFAARLGIGRTRLYVIIDELKSKGAPIIYSKIGNTFYYEYPYSISLEYIMQPLNKKECVETNGGGFLLPFFFCERWESTLASVTLQC
ncbi:MAG: DNA-binding protein [Bacteroidales bacterium]|nr:DNA-binding protein [Bacteroidales bacterium]